MAYFLPQHQHLDLRWQCRDYGVNNERGYLHLTQYWDGGGTDVFSKPMIMVKALPAQHQNLEQ